MGLQFFHSSFLPALYNITILVCLQHCGIKLSLHISSIMILRASINYGPPTYTIPSFIPSGPGALNGFIEVIASSISSIEISYSLSIASHLGMCANILSRVLVKSLSVSNASFLLNTWFSHCYINSSSSSGVSSILVRFFLYAIRFADFHASRWSLSFMSLCLFLAPSTLFFHRRWS